MINNKFFMNSTMKSARKENQDMDLFSLPKLGTVKTTKLFLFTSKVNTIG